MTNNTAAIQEWKTSYTQAIIETLRPFGDVLEVGFCSGFAASCIQKHLPKSHTIIEPDPVLAESARAWAANFENVSVLQDTWQNALPRLGAFNTIFLNASKEDEELEIVTRLPSETISQAGTHSTEMLNEIEKELSQLTIHYSDQDIDEFYSSIGQFNLPELPRFFRNLRELKFITEEQYEKATKKYSISKEIAVQPAAPRIEIAKPPDLMIEFVEACLNSHLHQGGRLSCYIPNSISKYEDSRFFGDIITRLDIDYQEKFIPIKIANCTFKDPLVMVIEKL